MESFLARFYNRPIGESATVWVGRLFGCVRKLPDEHSFSRFLTLSGLLRMNTAHGQAGSANIRLRWNYRPDSDLRDLHRRAAFR